MGSAPHSRRAASPPSLPAVGPASRVPPPRWRPRCPPLRLRRRRSPRPPPVEDLLLCRCCHCRWRRSRLRSTDRRRRSRLRSTDWRRRSRLLSTDRRLIPRRLMGSCSSRATETARAHASQGLRAEPQPLKRWHWICHHHVHLSCKCRPKLGLLLSTTWGLGAGHAKSNVGSRSRRSADPKHSGQCVAPTRGAGVFRV